MDIFKLFFNHDLRLDKLAKRNANKSKEEVEATLQDFMSPDPTYSKFYITATALEDKQFGLNTITKSNIVIKQLSKIFEDLTVTTTNASVYQSLQQAIQEIAIGKALVITNDTQIFESIDVTSLTLDQESKVGHKKDEIRTVIESGAYLMYKEPAHHGFDLHLFSEENIYPKLFHAFQPLVDNAFRFFSINNKRMRSERHFYFETWTLDNPPHGAEEVFLDTKI